MVIGDPSYFPEKVEKKGSVVRVICILNHPINQTNNAVSCQLIMPGNQIDRKNGRIEERVHLPLLVLGCLSAFPFLLDLAFEEIKFGKMKQTRKEQQRIIQESPRRKRERQ